MGGGSWAEDVAKFSNPPIGAAIYYFLKEKPKGELKIEIVDSDGKVIRTLSSVPREPDYSSESDDPEDFKKAALPVDTGVQRAVWDLKWEGAAKIKNAKIDTGDPANGPRAIPGTYTVRLSVDGKTVTSPLRVVPDPERSAPQADLEAQLKFALRVRDAISRLSGVVNRVRSVRDQLQARVKALEPRKSEAPVAMLITDAEGSIKKAVALEDRLHNPSAEIVYDILAERGGTRLYSRLSPLLMWAVEGEGQPTAGMVQVLEAQEKELAQLERDTEAWVMTDVAAVNQKAAAAGVQFIVIK
jgi:hypothetical protein